MTELKNTHTHTRPENKHYTCQTCQLDLVWSLQIEMSKYTWRGRPALSHLMFTQSCQPLARAGLSDINDGRGLSPGPPDKSVDWPYTTPTDRLHRGQLTPVTGRVGNAGSPQGMINFTQAEGWHHAWQL